MCIRDRHGAARAVRPDHVVRGGLVLAVRPADPQRHALFVLAQPGHLVPAPDHHPEGQGALFEQFLGAQLRVREHERERRGQPSEVQAGGQHAEVPVRHGQPAVEEGLFLPAHRQYLDRARVDGQRLRVRAALLGPFQDQWSPAAQGQLRRRPQPDRARADHDGVVCVQGDHSPLLEVRRVR